MTSHHQRKLRKVATLNRHLGHGAGIFDSKAASGLDLPELCLPESIGQREAGTSAIFLFLKPPNPQKPRVPSKALHDETDSKPQKYAKTLNAP